MTPGQPITITRGDFIGHSGVIVRVCSAKWVEADVQTSVGVIKKTLHTSFFTTDADAPSDPLAHLM